MIEKQYVIIQAGGRGTRMEMLTKHKPKALLPFGDKTLIQNIADEYPPGTEFIVISDYLHEVLSAYLFSVLNEYNWTVIPVANTTPAATGTCAGVKEALQYIPANHPFTIRWCDVLTDLPTRTSSCKGIEVFLTDKPCRKLWVNGRIENAPEFKQSCNGICGIFVISDKSLLDGIPESGEFTDFLQTKTEYIVTTQLSEIVELGTIEQYSAATHQCIFASKNNNIAIIGDYVVKRATKPEFNERLRDETEWYRVVSHKVKGVVDLWHDETQNECNCHYSMHKVDGTTLMNMNCSLASRLQVLRNIINTLKQIHALPCLETHESYQDACREMYIDKTVDRVLSVKDVLSGLIRHKLLIVNNKICTNPFYSIVSLEAYKDALGKIADNPRPAVIHGDPTLSNALVQQDLVVKLIDPRGKFGKISVNGDERYDWAKLYYSVIGNYDYVVSQQFLIDIDTRLGLVAYNIASHTLEFGEEEILRASGISKYEMLMLQSSIWFSLCGYITQNVDAIYLAFIKGCESYHDAGKLCGHDDASI
jgi:hypothetical protein